MDQGFDIWNEEKKRIHESILCHDLYINRREIWFVKMGKNIGFEENGKEQFLRSVVVIKKIGNLFFTAALTSKGKDNHPLYYKLDMPQLENPKYKDSSYVILSQVKVMDKKRFFQNIGTVSGKDFGQITQKLKTLLL